MKRTMGAHLTVSIALVLFLCAAQLPAQTFDVKSFDKYVDRVLNEFEVPGVAVSVVKDGKVVLAKGYGLRKIGEPAGVDSNTLFGIASNTKAFTAAALAILVDEGKIRWDDPVLEHLPDFQMYDPYVTREMTIRDLLTHRSGLGLGAGDLLFWPKTTYARQEIIRRLRFIKPASSFRSKYAYDNLLYVVAGEIIPAVTGKSWADFVKERFFTPLGMAASNTSIKEFRPGDDIALPHVRLADRVQAAEYMDIDNCAPAAAINSCVSDLAKWVLAQLDMGLIQNSQKEERLFSANRAREMWEAQTIIPIRKYSSELSKIKPNYLAYGLGWNLRDYRGYKIVYHTGVLLGQVSKVTMVPDLKLGIVVLTNQESHGAYESITYHIFDYYMKEAPPTDWIKEFQSADQTAQAEAYEIEKNQKLARAASSKPSLETAKYAGQYIDLWYGKMTIGLENGNLVMRFSRSPDLVGDLEHWHYDTFVVRWRHRLLKADAFVTFSLKYDGSIEQVKMIPVSPLTDFSFDFQDLLFRPAPAEK